MLLSILLRMTRAMNRSDPGTFDGDDSEIRKVKNYLSEISKYKKEKPRR